jgi:hypothetical protein
MLVKQRLINWTSTEPLAIARTLTALDKIESSALDSGIIRVTQWAVFLALP